MRKQQKPVLGALLLALFITACLGWLFHGSGTAMPLWGYPLVFLVFVGWLYGVGRLLINSDENGNPVRSNDISIESQ